MYPVDKWISRATQPKYWRHNNTRFIIIRAYQEFIKIKARKKYAYKNKNITLCTNIPTLLCRYGTVYCFDDYTNFSVDNTKKKELSDIEKDGDDNEYVR